MSDDKIDKILIFNRLRRLLIDRDIWHDDEGCVYLDTENLDAEKTAKEIKKALVQVRDFGKEAQ